MRDDKTCRICKRHYRGEGYQGVCTEDCYMKWGFSQKIQREKQTKCKAALQQEECKPRFTETQKANERWLKRKAPEGEKKRNPNGEKLSRNHLKSQWYGRQYRAVRG